MCHLTEIPPMRRIDLQPDVTRVRMLVCCTSCACMSGRPGSVGADPRNGWRDFCSPAKNCERRVAKHLFIAPRPPERVAREPQRARDKYGAKDRSSISSTKRLMLSIK